MAVFKGVNGTVADVSDGGRILTDSTTRSIEEDANLDGRVFVIQFDLVTPLAADDFFFYFQNLDTRDVIIKTWRELSTLAAKVTMELVGGTPSFSVGTDASVTNRNGGVSSVLDAIAKFDVNITALIPQGILAFHGHGVINQLDTINLDSGVVVPQGKAIALKRVGTGGTFDVLLTVEVQK